VAGGRRRRRLRMDAGSRRFTAARSGGRERRGLIRSGDSVDGLGELHAGLPISFGIRVFWDRRSSSQSHPRRRRVRPSLSPALLNRMLRRGHSPLPAISARRRGSFDGRRHAVLARTLGRSRPVLILPAAAPGRGLHEAGLRLPRRQLRVLAVRVTVVGIIPTSGEAA